MMLDYEYKSGNSNSSSEDVFLGDRVPSAATGSISLTALWEIIVRTKRLPDDLEPSVIFILLRERLRNPEREIRLHALRVLADLIPVIQTSRLQLEKLMVIILPELVTNLSHVAPAVRKSTVDALRIYLNYVPSPGDFLRALLTVEYDNSHLMVGIVMAVPHFVNLIDEDTLTFLLDNLFLGLQQDFLKDTAFNSLVKVRHKIGDGRFRSLLSVESLQKFDEMCETNNVHDNVILETEIKLEKGPAITMQIHEAEEAENFAANDKGAEWNNYESGGRSPRKVRFGGEVVKMRTPESDSNNQSTDVEEDNHHHHHRQMTKSYKQQSKHHSGNYSKTSVIIDRPTSIKITVSEGVTAIKTKHRSQIPLRITTSSEGGNKSAGSNPTTPSKSNKGLSGEKKRIHKSAPELRQVSKIPLRNSLKTTQPQKSARRSSREDQFSPIPVHNEIELFHNLTRSPTPERKSSNVPQLETNEQHSEEHNQQEYESFQIFKDPNVNIRNIATAAPPKETSEKEDPFIGILTDLNTDDLWTRSLGLDDLLSILPKQGPNNLPLSQFLSALFVIEPIQRLQVRSQEALRMIISGINLQTLQESLPLFTTGLAKMGAPSGVQLALLTMERCSPKKFFENFKANSQPPNPNPRIPEGVLQLLIAAARTFPSSEIDAVKGTQLACQALKDKRRAVRQAALEALASLAQVGGNAIVLETVIAMAPEFEEPEVLMRVIRTRLSRRQLPTVDLRGNVRYSSPREPEEFDWVCGSGGRGGVSKLEKTTSLNNFFEVRGSNYWKHNLRHDLDLTDQENHEADETAKERIWLASNPPTLSSRKTNLEKASLCPVYVLHRDTNPHTIYRNYDRGKSDSPSRNPQQTDQNQENSHTNGRRFLTFPPRDNFRKSFSSEHLYNPSGSNSNSPIGGRMKLLPEATSFSLSSRSSTTSTGSSTKSGLWLRSGIPVPITSDSKFKIRSVRSSEVQCVSGPLIAPVQESSNRVNKFEGSPKIPGIMKSPTSQGFGGSINNNLLHQPPPPSSGSESSGYFTPPAEHHLKDQVLEVLESFEADDDNNNDNIDNNNNNDTSFSDHDQPVEPNFEVLESENERQSSAASSLGLPDRVVQSLNTSTDEVDHIEEVKSSRVTTPQIFVGNNNNSNNNSNNETPPRIFSSSYSAANKNKSRSEINLQDHHQDTTTLPEITNRKIISSAPPLNEATNTTPVLPLPFGNFTEITQTTTVTTSFTLPGSVTPSGETTPTKPVVNESPKRLVLRQTKISSLKRSKSVKVPESRPSARPKETLNQVLAQMDSSDWEVSIQGLNSLVTLSSNHPDVLEAQIHAVCVALSKNIKNLRSQVARVACHASSELFASCKRGLDMELEELAGPLLQRTADTNKFLRADANAALDTMAQHLCIPRVVAVVAGRGATHQNCVVRAAATRIVCDVAMKIGPEKIYQMSKETRDKFFLVGANGLTEGSLDVRKYAKGLMGVLVQHSQFQRVLADSVPQHTIRHISKAIGALK